MGLLDGILNRLFKGDAGDDPDAADETLLVTARKAMRFVGATITDVPGKNRVDIELAGGGGLSAIAAARMLGNFTAGSAVPTAKTAAEVRTFLNVADGATANAGTVTSVSGTAPIAVATGTTTPVVSLNDGGVSLAKMANMTGPAALARLSGTGAPQSTSLVETPTAAVSIPLRTATGGLKATRFHLDTDDNYFGDPGNGTFIEGAFVDVGPSGDASLAPGGDVVLNPGGSIFCGSKQLKSVADPTSAQHAATMGWVQANAVGKVTRGLTGKDLTAAAAYSDMVDGATTDVAVGASTNTLVEVHLSAYRKVAYVGEGGPATARDSFVGTFRAEVTRDAASPTTPTVTIEASDGDTVWVLTSASGKTVKVQPVAVSGGFKLQVYGDQITTADYAGALSITSAALNISAVINTYPVATIA